MEMILLATVAYLLPTIIAAKSRKRNAWAIFALNLLLGWSVLGWIVALVWALCHDEPARAVAA